MTQRGLLEQFRKGTVLVSNILDGKMLTSVVCALFYLSRNLKSVGMSFVLERCLGTLAFIGNAKSLKNRTGPIQQL